MQGNRSGSGWPKTGAELKAAGYHSCGRSKCRDCEAEIIWAETPNGKKMPMEEAAPRGGERTFQGHWNSCPAAEQRRGTGRGQQPQRRGQREFF